MRSSDANRPRRVGYAVALLLALSGIRVIAGAHSVLKTSHPPEGARLKETPEAVRLTFTEPVEMPLSVFKVYPLAAPPEALAGFGRGIQSS